ncbi:MAG: tripartite tricarboxylate transporter substrate binding protein [Hyphomicrobiales bacterium]|nr:tripartite tricarboxylate transporter substrate binding protein [Hyphomicrobiales bacterium]
MRFMRLRCSAWSACAVIGAAGWVLATPSVGAQTPIWPTKRVQIVVPFAPGSATDLVPRTVFEQVSAKVGQPFVIENKPGGGGAVGVSSVAKADPDGYTVLVHSNAFVTAPAIQPMPYDPVQDFAGITTLATLPMVLVISPEKKIKTLKEFVAAAKSGTMNYAAAGIGSPPHLTMERFRLAAGFAGQLVPFRGAPEALTEIIAGRVDVYFSPLTPALPFIKDGKLVPLAVGSAKRAAALPDVPTTVEAGFPDTDFDFWIGMTVPKRTPRDVIARIHQVTASGLEDPAVKEKLAKLGVEPLVMKPEEFDARIAREAPIAAALAKAAGIAAK